MTGNVHHPELCKCDVHNTTTPGFCVACFAEARRKKQAGIPRPPELATNDVIHCGDNPTPEELDEKKAALRHCRENNQPLPEQELMCGSCGKMFLTRDVVKKCAKCSERETSERIRSILQFLRDNGPSSVRAISRGVCMPRSVVSGVVCKHRERHWRRVSRDKYEAVS